MIMTAYITGTSTRKVDDLVKALGCDTGISKSSVSRICKNIDAGVSVLRNRDLGHQAFVYLWLDATCVHVREGGQVVSKAVVIATGLRADGHREVLGVDVGDSENETFWTELLRSLKDRNLHGVRLVISDAHADLKAAIRRVFQGAVGQRCRVHAMRNLLADAKHQHRLMIAALIRTIFAKPDPEGARTQLRAVVDQLEPVAPAVAAKLEAAEHDLLAYSAFPQAHWSNACCQGCRSSRSREQSGHPRGDSTGPCHSGLSISVFARSDQTGGTRSGCRLIEARTSSRTTAQQPVAPQQLEP